MKNITSGLFQKMENFLVPNENKLRAAIPDRAIRVWGIDLGTSNSAISEILWLPDSDAPPHCKCLELKQPAYEGAIQETLVPSFVASLLSGETIVGEWASQISTLINDSTFELGRNLFSETKNDMGLKKTYYKAGENFNAAWKIAGHILKFIKQAAEDVTGAKPDRIVISVPASFQLSQRRDTLRAAEMAGFEIKDFDLIDEPTAALLDYLSTRHSKNAFTQGISNNVLVFDFGGGTCDISIVRAEIDGKDSPVKASMIATSRYHLLGGRDLDKAIVHEHLLPSLARENGLSVSDLSWSDKKRCLEPQLRRTAEALKINMCNKVRQLINNDSYESSDKKLTAVETHPVECFLGSRNLQLKQPQLTAHEWEELLEPFLDTEFLYARETEYRLTHSIFAPIQDALDRAGMKPQDIHMVVLTGGSSLIPQVKQALSEYFKDAKKCIYKNPMNTQLAVSRGAAWHAFFLEMTKRPFIQPVVPEEIALLTNGGKPYTLIPAGSPIPWPQDGSFSRLTNLEVPQTFVKELKMEIVARCSGQPLFTETWQLNHVVSAGDPITLEYRIGSNHELECCAYLAGNPCDTFERTVENPLVSVSNPNKTRIKIEELEEELRQKGGPSANDRDTLIELARCYADLRQHDRAQDNLRTALRLINQPDYYILNLRGIYYGESKDYSKEEKAYLEASKAGPEWGGAKFNLSLHYQNKNQHEKALESIEEALRIEPESAPYLVKKGLCLKSLGKTEEALIAYDEAIYQFNPLEDLNDWALGWYETCAEQLNRKDLLEKISEERKKRRGSKRKSKSDDMLRPVVKGGLQRREA